MSITPSREKERNQEKDSDSKENEISFDVYEYIYWYKEETVYKDIRIVDNAVRGGGVNEGMMLENNEGSVDGEQDELNRWIVGER